MYIIFETSYAQYDVASKAPKLLLSLIWSYNLCKNSTVKAGLQSSQKKLEVMKIYEIWILT